jgi:hypothetical protein
VREREKKEREREREREREKNSFKLDKVASIKNCNLGDEKEGVNCKRHKQEDMT